MAAPRLNPSVWFELSRIMFLEKLISSAGSSNMKYMIIIIMNVKVMFCRLSLVDLKIYVRIL